MIAVSPNNALFRQVYDWKPEAFPEDEVPEEMEGRYDDNYVGVTCEGKVLRVFPASVVSYSPVYQSPVCHKIDHRMLRLNGGTREIQPNVAVCFGLDCGLNMSECGQRRKSTREVPMKSVCVHVSSAKH